MTQEEREARFTAKQEAQQRRDAAIAAAAEQFRLDCAADGREHAAVFDRIREDYRLAWEAAKARPAPTHDAAKAKRDAAIAQAERQYEAELQALFLQQSND